MHPTPYEGRAEYYSMARPSYPIDVVSTLQARGFLLSGMEIADIGAGTGKLSELFLHAGYKVIGIEPEADMRRVARRELGHFPNFRMKAGSSGDIPLPDNRVDLISAGQSFHWFDQTKALAEFRRVLRTPRKIVTVDNRIVPGMETYWGNLRRFLRKFKIDMPVSSPYKGDREAGRTDFFSRWSLVTFPNHQVLNFEGLIGRVLSISNKPLADHPEYDALMRALKREFDAHQVGGVVTLEYETRVYYGEIE